MKSFLTESQRLAPGIVVILASLLAYYCQAATPDPLTLLKGVEQARLQIPPSRLTVQLIYTNAAGRGTEEHIIEFDGSKRRYSTENAKGCELFNGSNVVSFDGSRSVTICDTDQASADYLFDPRLLGITTTYTWGETVKTAVPCRGIKQLALIGADHINRHSVWHVHLIDSYDQQINLWIDSEHGFKVYRYDFNVIGETNSTLAYYDDQSYPWLPSRVETSYRGGKDGSILAGRSIFILKAKANIKLPKNTWTIAGVRPSIGAAVVDLRMKMRLGYWNGHGLSENPDVEPQFNPAKWVTSIRAKWIIILVIMTILPGVIIWLWQFCLSKRKVGPHS